MNKIRELIEKRITDAGPGYVFTRKDFQDIASSGSIGQILSRMVKDGVIRRIGRGVFDFPNTNPALGDNLVLISIKQRRPLPENSGGLYFHTEAWPQTVWACHSKYQPSLLTYLMAQLKNSELKTW